MSWIEVPDVNLLSENKSYLVRWRQADGKFSQPHRAYYVFEEGRFFSSETQSDHPIAADLFIEIPEVE